MRSVIALPALLVLTLATGCLDEDTGDDQSSSDPEDQQLDCVPFLTCPTEGTTEPEPDPEDQTWDCIPILTCPQN